MESVVLNNQNIQRYPCIVCCRVFARDRDLIIIDEEFWCESNIWDDEDSCGFGGRATSLEEVIKLAEERVEYLKSWPNGD